MRKAFTIVELLVVMAVIGILITLAVVGIQAIQKAQRETTRLNDMRNLLAFIEEYNSKFRMYPKHYSFFINDTSGEGKVICIYRPEGWYSGVDTNCTISNIGTGLYNRLIFQQPGAEIYGNNFSGVDIDTTVTAPGGDCEVPKSPDNWTIYYRSNIGINGVEYPQQFGLYACTENGLTQKFGELK